MSRTWELWVIATVILFVVVMMGTAAGVKYYRAAQTAATYNRLTGNDLTTWEALWIEVRLDCNA